MTGFGYDKNSMSTAKSSNTDSHVHAFPMLRRRAMIRILGASFIVIVTALAISMQASSTPSDLKRNASDSPSALLQTDVVKDSTNDANSSASEAGNSSVNSTTAINSGSADNNSSGSVSMTVNGQSVQVPQNGSVSKVITTPDGSTSVNVSNNSTGNGTSFSSSFTSSNQNSQSTISTFDSQIQQSFNSP